MLTNRKQHANITELSQNRQQDKKHPERVAGKTKGKWQIDQAVLGSNKKIKSFKKDIDRKRQMC